MNLNYTSEAVRDLEAIDSYIRDDNPAAAERTVTRILQAIAILETFPLLGRPGRVAETRELPIAGLPYFAVYRIADATEIDVIAIMHERRRYPPA